MIWYLNAVAVIISMKLFRRIKEIGASAYITASSVTDIFYIIRKETHNTDRTYVIMENIFRLVAILSVTDKDIKDAFGQKWKDFEDCVQYMRQGKTARWIISSQEIARIMRMLCCLL